MNEIRHRLLRGLAAATWPRFAALAAVLLLLPTVPYGLLLDDLPQRVLLLGLSDVDVRPIDVFASIDGSAATVRTFADQGFLPWWSAPDLRFAFCRPLSALTHVLDYRLWPGAPWAMHLHNLAWLAAAVFAAALAYRRLLGPVSGAGLAALLFALDDSLAVPAAWIANRNALIAATFGLLALAAHDRWRRDGWRVGGLAAPACLALALVSAEMSLGAVAYLVAYALVMETGPFFRRLATLAPSGAVFIAWAALYQVFGFGARGSGLYIDPATEPLRFLAEFAVRAPALALGAWTPIPADLANLLPRSGQVALAGLTVVLLALVARLAWPVLRVDRAARLFALGFLACLIPAAATNPSDRLILFASFGVFGLVARLAEGLVESTSERSTSPAPKAPGWLAKGAIVLLLIVHLPLSAAMTPWTARTTKDLGEPIVRSVDRTFPADPRIAGQDVYILNPPDYLLDVAYVPSIQLWRGRPVPRRLRGLAAGPVPLSVERTDGRTLVLEAQDGFLSGPLGRLFRGPNRPLRAGERVELPGLSVVVLGTTSDGAPARAEFRFDRALDDPDLRFLIWQGEGYAPFAVPAVGGRVELPTPRGVFERLAGR